MAMVAEGALEEDPKDRAASGIADTFTAVVEGKEGVKSVRKLLVDESERRLGLFVVDR